MPSIREIAAACGVSKSTVSSALRKEPIVAPETRKLIEKTAKELGYNTDAYMVQLMSHVRKGKHRKAHCNLAWLNANADRNYFKRNYARSFFELSQKRATELGYHLDEIWVGDPQLTSKKIENIFSSRGIQGLILPFTPNDADNFQINWNKYVTVGIAYLNPQLPINWVSTHYLDGIILACRQLHALGYRRPGLYLDLTSDMQSGLAFSSGFTRMQQLLFPDNIIPLPQNLNSLPPIDQWYSQHKPDVILCTAHGDYDALIDAGIRIPEDVALIHMRLGLDTPNWAGLDFCLPALTETCVDFIVAQINQGEKGLPQHPKHIMVEGEWHHGWTAPGIPERLKPHPTPLFPAP